jgi:hypothetical protein
VPAGGPWKSKTSVWEYPRSQFALPLMFSILSVTYMAVQYCITMSPSSLILCNVYLLVNWQPTYWTGIGVFDFTILAVWELAGYLIISFMSSFLGIISSASHLEAPNYPIAPSGLCVCIRECITTSSLIKTLQPTLQVVTNASTRSRACDSSYLCAVQDGRAIVLTDIVSEKVGAEMNDHPWYWDEDWIPIRAT